MEIEIMKYSAICGDLVLGVYNRKLCLCDWVSEKRKDVVGGRLRRLLKADFVERRSSVAILAIEQLDEYLKGNRTDFDLQLLLAGTQFQIDVWNELLKIPYGTTFTYKEIASALGRPTSVRAVANAIGMNAISIFVPCHRVIGADGSLTGYAGGLSAKRALLSIER